MAEDRAQGVRGPAFRVIAGEQHPDHRCIREFRRIHHARFSDVFVQVLKARRRVL